MTSIESSLKISYCFVSSMLFFCSELNPATSFNLSNRFKTALICNSNELITGDFTRNPKLQLNSKNMKFSLTSNFKSKSIWFINSTENK